MTRTATDTMGEMTLPDGALWGASTQRAVENFPIANRPVPVEVIRAFGLLKLAAAQTNAELDELDAEVAKAIEAACEQVIAGELDDQFPVDIFQTGSGTSTNMNANEVIANVAKNQLGEDLDSDRVHPNNHVNWGQSSNDTFPSACHIAAAVVLTRDLVPALQHLASTLRDKAASFDGILKSGRTHLMDATPVTLGQEFAGFARQVELGIDRLQATMPRLTELALGGTAVGTGLNCPPGFPAKTISRISERTGIDFREAEDHFEAQGARDALVEVSGATKVVAVSLMKIANDIRWLSSGPRTGLAELEAPAVQPGSSIMPGKVNPVIAESVRQVSAQVVGNDSAVTVGGLGGELELNVMIPVMITNVLESMTLTANVSRLFADKCVAGLTATEAGPTYVERSLMQVTALVPAIGYDRAAKIAKDAHKTGQTLREAALADGVEAAVLDEALDFEAMAKPPGQGA